MPTVEEDEFFSEEDEEDIVVVQPNAATGGGESGPSSSGTQRMPTDDVVDQVISNQGTDLAVPPHTTSRIHNIHPFTQIIGNPDAGVQTRRQSHSNDSANVVDCMYSTIFASGIPNYCAFGAYVSQVEPKGYKEALRDPYWVQSMQDELSQFAKLGVWRLVDPPKGHKVIGTKWVLKCKRDDKGIIVRNKARLVVKGFSQV
jgi:hypothetical protein